MLPDTPTSSSAVCKTDIGDFPSVVIYAMSVDPGAEKIRRYHVPIQYDDYDEQNMVSQLVYLFNYNDYGLQ